jgi:hypothetical protein
MKKSKSLLVLLAVLSLSTLLIVPGEALAKKKKSPTCTLTASPNAVMQGGSLTLSWSTTRATTFEISNVGTVAPVGTGWVVVVPESTGSYTGTVVGRGGTATCAVYVEVRTTRLVGRWDISFDRVFALPPDGFGRVDDLRFPEEHMLLQSGLVYEGGREGYQGVFPGHPNSWVYFLSYPPTHAGGREYIEIYANVPDFSGWLDLDFSCQTFFDPINMWGWGVFRGEYRDGSQVPVNLFAGACNTIKR